MRNRLPSGEDGRRNLQTGSGSVVFCGEMQRVRSSLCILRNRPLCMYRKYPEAFSPGFKYS